MSKKEYSAKSLKQQIIVIENMIKMIGISRLVFLGLDSWLVTDRIGDKIEAKTKEMFPKSWVKITHFVSGYCITFHMREDTFWQDERGLNHEVMEDQVVMNIPTKREMFLSAGEVDKEIEKKIEYLGKEIIMYQSELMLLDDIDKQYEELMDQRDSFMLYSQIIINEYNPDCTDR